MKFSIGDAVRLKRTGEEGTLKAVLKGGMYEVEVDGTSFPVYADEVEHPYFNRFSNARKAVRAKEGTSLQPGIPSREKAAPRRQPSGVHLSFLPEYAEDATEHVVRLLRIFLYNELAQDIRFAYDVHNAGGESLFHLQGSIPAFSHLYLHNLSIADAGAAPRYHWLLSGASAGDPPQPVTLEGTLLLKPALLARKLQKLAEEGFPTFSETLLEDFIPRPDRSRPAEEILEDMKKNAALAVQSISWSSGKQFPQVLDLHAASLGLDGRNLPASWLLERQLATLRSWLDAARTQPLSTIVVIHGVGSGKLRDAVHAVLRADAGVAQFTNAWSGRYGFGATEIRLK